MPPKFLPLRLALAAALVYASIAPNALSQIVTPVPSVPAPVGVPGLGSTSPSAPMPAVPAAQATPTQAVPAQPAPHMPEPAPQPTVPDLTRYLNNPDLLKFSSAQVSQFVNTKGGHDADILFLGDSITQGWLGAGRPVWEANFANRNALDFGISGDETQHVLWRMDNYPIQHLHPKVAVVLIGTNNFHNTAPEIASGVKAVLTKTQTMYPGIKIILVSIMPNRRANDLMMAANAMIRTYADDTSIYYLDLVPLMTPDGDNWKGLGRDHLHPDASGYQLWTDAMMPLLNKLLPPATPAP